MSRSAPAFLLRSSALRVTNSVVAALIGFFMMPFLVGHLGDHDYGVWVVATSLVGTYYLLDFGLAASVMRFAAVSIGTGDTRQLSRVVSTALVVYLALAVLVLIASIGLSLWAPQWKVAAQDAGAFSHVIVVTGLSMALGFPFKAFAGILQARLRYDLVSWNSLLTMVIGTVATVWLVSHGYGIVALAYVGFCTGMLSNLIFLWNARREAPGLEMRRSLFDRELVRRMASFSVWSFLIQIAGQLRFRIDALVIGSIQSAAAVTQYSVGSRLSEIPDGMLYQATNVVQPLLTGYHAVGQRQRMLEALALYTRINVALGVFVAGMLLIMGEAFINLWMGPDYSTSVLVLYALALSRCVGFLLNPLDNSLYAIGRIRFLAIVSLLDALANVALSIWLGKRYGIVGVALGTLIPVAISRIFVIVPYVCARIGWPLSDYIATAGRPLLVGLAVLLLAWAAFDGSAWPAEGYGPMFVFASSCGVLYLGIMFALGLSASDRATVLSALRSAFGHEAGRA